MTDKEIEEEYPICEKCGLEWTYHDNSCEYNIMSDTIQEMREYLKEQIEYYDKLSETRNGFELACMGGRDALKKALEYFINLKNN